MKNLTMAGDKRMTVREVAEVLGVSVDTITRSVKELYPDLMEHGKKTYLTEGQVTEVKYNLRKTAEVINAPKTDLEKALLIRQAMQFQNEIIENLQADNQRLKQEKQALVATNQELTVEVSHADTHANYVIGIHQWHGEKALAKYGGLPYWFDH